MKKNSIQKRDESEELYYEELAKMGFKVVRENSQKNSIQKRDDSEELYYEELAKMGFKVVREKSQKTEISSDAKDNHLKPIPLGVSGRLFASVLVDEVIEKLIKSSKQSKSGSKSVRHVVNCYCRCAW